MAPPFSLSLLQLVRKTVLHDEGSQHGQGDPGLTIGAAGLAEGALLAGDMGAVALACVVGAVLVGKYRAPCWPQADKVTAQKARANGLTRILGKCNMVKL